MALLHEERSCLSRAWDHWQWRARQEREKRSASDTLYRHTLLHNTLSQWKDNVTMIRDRRILRVWKETAALLPAARSREQRTTTSTVFRLRCCWLGGSHILCSVKPSPAERGSEQGSVTLIKCGSSMFRLWTMYQQQSYKKIVLQHRRREAEQIDLALWHWSLSLQAKVLEAVGRGAAPEAGEAGPGCPVL
ncbi:hypothetical protein J4Q44_G00106530 [Coregonus suidteri]|uniref:Uncharacterized protein n=1 Tax=Coregonus suidteri TaxID=861788 RepID=A0AAN8M1R0_9TELE